MAKIKLSKIVLDESLYPRDQVNAFTVQRYKSAMETGEKFPALVVEAKTYRLIEGWKRYHAYKELEVTECEVEIKSYASEADAFADAVRLNALHGEPLTAFNIKNAVIKLISYGYTVAKISEVVKMPVSKIEKLERGFTTSAKTGEPIPLKGGLSHLRGIPLAPKQIEVNRHYSGMKAVFYINQLIQLIENDMWPRSEMFAIAMDNLIEAWKTVSEIKPAAPPPKSKGKRGRPPSGEARV
jgi:hypothetical protein